MTISNTVTSSNIIKRADSLSDMNLLRSYPLREGKRIEVFFDSIKGAKTIVHENGKETELHFSDSGIPSELRFSFCKLKSYLEDTYASYNGGRVFINCRLRGGGHSSHTNHWQTFSKAPPPPQRIPVNYSAGYVITGLNRPEVQGGTFVEESGGVGHRNYSVVFQTHNASLKPSVTITVNKSEYNASDIRRLQSIRDQIFSNISGKKKESSDLESRISTIQSFNQGNIAKKQQKSQELTELESNREYESNLRIQEQEIDRLKQRFQEVGGNIRSLISFLELSETYNLGINLHSDALELFFRNKSEVNRLISSQLDIYTLLGKCVNSARLWLEDSRKSVGKDVIALIGNTGTGKSTAVNYLLGSPIFYDEQTQAMRVAEGYEEFAKIGNRSSTSETLYTQIHQNSDFLFADCGGFLDTRGPEQEFQAMASLKATLSNSSTVKLVLCFDSNALRIDRGSNFSQFVRTVLQDFLRDYRETRKSVMLMFTKPFFHRDGRIFSSVDAIADIKKMMEDTDSVDLRNLYDFLLRDSGKYISVCEPTDGNSRLSMLKMLSEMNPIQSKETFHVPCSPALRNRLFEETTSIAHQANELQEAFQRASKEVSRLKPLVLDKEKKKLALKKELEQLEKTIQTQSSELSQVQSLKGRVLGELRQLEQQKSQKDSEISNLSSGVVRYKSDGGSWQIS